MRINTLLLIMLSLVGMSCAAANERDNTKINVGITLQPYYSYVSAVVGDRANIIPLVDPGFNPHNYLPQPKDMQRLEQMDVIVVNGIGHDDFAMKVISAAQRDDLIVIKANKDVPYSLR
ncbi:cation ABC transporter periplasmic cation-binding protein [Vibrio maritimus]|uniref:High-affinity zinc uptake system protein ZnuA n=1 Tax=Vibrio maritimus TaxID=990268 RepID=A0A090RQ38_9VIBR|nr:cation ABC transporter periplasmic cation-binding protein [Vibrio maritimus]